MEAPGLKVMKFPGVSQECPEATPDPSGGNLQRAAEAYVWKVVSLTPTWLL